MVSRRWAPIIFGAAVFVAFIAIGAVVFSLAWVREHLDIESATAQSAEAAFNEVRQRYHGKPPLLEMHGPSVAQRNLPRADAPRMPLAVLHVLAWDADEGKLARFDIPFWLFRLKESPIRFGAYAAGLDDLQISLRAADIERYGPGIIVDITRAGRDSAVLWVE